MSNHDPIPVPNAANIRYITAPNPSPMTFTGTNTFLVGAETLAIIDPGPKDSQHLNAIIEAVGNTPVSAILVTHAHLDHSPLARPLANAANAPIYAFGPAQSGRSKVMQQLADQGLTQGGEGVDHDFQPDHILQDGDTVDGPGWSLRAIHTPGHMGNHLCFAMGDVLFTGDHIMGWASSLVSPPDGDLTDFMASCAKLQQENWRLFLPAHGDPVTTPAERLAWLINHRKGREAQIIAALRTPLPLSELTHTVYADIDQRMLPAAARNLFAHLVDLHGRGVVTATPSLSEGALFQLKKI